MSTTAEAVSVPLPRAGLVAPSVLPRSPWLVSPWFDLLFLANLAWPIWVLVSLAGSEALGKLVGFGMVYVLITPHRWITLSLVFLDRERFRQRPRAFLGIALLAALPVLAVACWQTVALGTDTLQTVAFLLVVDYFWNSWHFAAQHSGIGRIYGRVAHPDDKSSAMLEKVVLRVFILYVLFRLAGAPLMGIERAYVLGWFDWLVGQVKFLDLPMLALPMFLLARELPGLTRAGLGRLIYLGSVCFLYSAVLLAAHFHPLGVPINPLLGGLILALTVFHSAEYLAIVSWSVKKRHARSTEGVWAHLVPRWGVALVTFMCALGLSAWMIDRQFVREWLLVSIFVSYLHYAYDGMIWKARRPATAAVA